MAEEFWCTTPSEGKKAYVKKFAAGSTLLDIGSGRGFYAQYAQQLGFSVLGVDVGDLREERGFSFALADVTALPVRSQSFDTVLLFDVLEHIEREDEALAELARVTRDTLILSVPHRDDGNLPRYNLTFLHHKDKSHHREYDEPTLRARLGAHGFAVTHLFREGPVLPAVLAEHFRSRLLGRLYRSLVYRIVKWGLLKRDVLCADLYVIAKKR